MAHQISESAAMAELVDEEKTLSEYPVRCDGCNKLPINCYQTHHECRLCQLCAVKWLQDCQRSRKCPCGAEDCIDRSDEDLIRRGPLTPDLGTRREVNNLWVKCPNNSKGCTHRCKWKELDQHLSHSCKFETIKCELCNQEVARCLLNISHKNLLSESCCPAFTATCPHCRSSKLLNLAEFHDHLESPCPHRPEKCKFERLGCQVTASGAELSDHYRECGHEHLQLMTVSSEHKLETLARSFDERLRALELQLCHSQANKACHAQTQTKSGGASQTSSGASLESPTSPGETVANAAMPSNELRVENPAGFSETGMRALSAALRMFSEGADCESILLQTLEGSPELLRTRNADGDNLLALALRTLPGGRAKKLVDLAVKVNPTALCDISKNLETVLMLSVSYGDESIATHVIRRILECNPGQLLQVNSLDRNVLHLCALRNSTLALQETLQSARQLLQTGRLEAAALEAAVKRKDQWGNTALGLMEARKRSDMRQVLISFCQDVNICLDVSNSQASSSSSSISSISRILVQEQPSQPDASTCTPCLAAHQSRQSAGQTVDPAPASRSPVSETKTERRRSEPLVTLHPFSTTDLLQTDY